MKITTDHPASARGTPVMLDDSGAVIGTAAGVKLLRERLGLSTTQFGEATGFSRRTVEGWEQGRAPTAAALNAMAAFLKKRRTRKAAREAKRKTP